MAGDHCARGLGGSRAGLGLALLRPAPIVCSHALPCCGCDADLRAGRAGGTVDPVGRGGPAAVHRMAQHRHRPIGAVLPAQLIRGRAAIPAAATEAVGA